MERKTCAQTEPTVIILFRLFKSVFETADFFVSTQNTQGKSAIKLYSHCAIALLKSHLGLYNAPILTGSSIKVPSIFLNSMLDTVGV